MTPRRHGFSRRDTLKEIVSFSGESGVVPVVAYVANAAVLLLRARPVVSSRGPAPAVPARLVSEAGARARVPVATGGSAA